MARAQRGEQALALGALRAAGEQAHVQRHVLHHARDGVEVLLRKDLRGRHQGALVPVVQRDQHAEQRHQRLAAAHVALHQPAHLPPAAHVLADLLHHALLRIGGLEGDVLRVERIEELAHPFEAYTLHVPRHQHLLLQQLQLNEEEFLEFQAPQRQIEGALVPRRMGLAMRFKAGDAAQVRDQRGIERFRQFEVRPLEQCLREPLQAPAVEPLGGGLLRGAVHRLQGGVQPGLPLGGRFQLGMRHVQPTPEVSDLAEHDELGALFQRRLDPTNPLEPDQLDAAGGVGEPGREAAGLLLPQGLHLGDDPAQLHIVGLTLQVPHGVEAAAVHVAEREVLQQVAEGGDAQFGA